MTHPSGIFARHPAGTFIRHPSGVRGPLGGGGYLAIGGGIFSFSPDGLPYVSGWLIPKDELPNDGDGTVSAEPWGVTLARTFTRNGAFPLNYNSFVTATPTGGTFLVDQDILYAVNGSPANDWSWAWIASGPTNNVEGFDAGPNPFSRNGRPKYGADTMASLNANTASTVLVASDRLRVQGGGWFMPYSYEINTVGDDNGYDKPSGVVGIDENNLAQTLGCGVHSYRGATLSVAAFSRIWLRLTRGTGTPGPVFGWTDKTTDFGFGAGSFSNVTNLALDPVTNTIIAGNWRQFREYDIASDGTLAYNGTSHLSTLDSGASNQVNWDYAQSRIYSTPADGMVYLYALGEQQDFDPITGNTTFSYYLGQVDLQTGSLLNMVTLASVTQTASAFPFAHYRISKPDSSGRIYLSEWVANNSQDTTTGRVTAYDTDMNVRWRLDCVHQVDGQTLQEHRVTNCDVSF